jgi:hypothetical protein
MVGGRIGAGEFAVTELKAKLSSMVDSLKKRINALLKR